MADKPRRPAFFWFVLLLCGAYTFFFVFTTYVTVRSYGVVKRPGWTVGYWPDSRGWVVRDVNETGPASGRLQRGDRLLAMNGDARVAIWGTAMFINVPGDKMYRVDVDRNGQSVSVDLRLPLAGGLYLYPFFLVCSLAFFICGAALGFLRPQDAQVRFVSALLMSVGFTALHEALGAPRGFLVGRERFAHLALSPGYMLFCPMTYHFFSRFPTWRRPSLLWRSMQWVLYAMFAMIFAPLWVLLYMRLDVSEDISQWLVGHSSLYLTVSRLVPVVYVYTRAGGCRAQLPARERLR